MEFKNIVEEVKELYDLLLITDKNFKNSKLHGKQLKSILDIIQIKQNDIINYVLEKNGKPPKKFKIIRGGYNKKISNEEPETNTYDCDDFKNIVNSLIENNDDEEADKELLSLKSVVSSDDLNEVINE